MARVGIVGTGWGARVQVPTFREAGLDVVAIASFHRDRTRELADELGLRPYDDWRKLVASAGVDLVSIVTPPSEHREMAIAALEAGKHVLCEKPTALNAAEAEELVTAAKGRPEQIALIDHELRFLPAWREARARLPELGPVRYVEVRYSSPSRGDRTRAWNWWSDASRGGGIWGAVGSHYVDAIRYFGMEVESVQAMLRTIIDRRPFEGASCEVTADDFASVDLRLVPQLTPSAVEGSAEPLRLRDHRREGSNAPSTAVGVNWVPGILNFSAVASGPDENSLFTIYCEGGAMRFSGEEVLLSTNGSQFTRMAGETMQARPGNSPGGAFGTGTLHLGRALRAAIDDGNRDALAPAATFEDGWMQQRVLDAARQSSASGGGFVAV
ncbi:MAG TPA: Gfo/Idh/MocA family oxidoreductase [Thermoanaerobaculia bacterium]|nr:Gfo/Idh/MocA family oxidoreductase [Thermoanaerobaculia bacterium]